MTSFSTSISSYEAEWTYMQSVKWPSADDQRAFVLELQEKVSNLQSIFDFSLKNLAPSHDTPLIGEKIQKLSQQISAYLVPLVEDVAVAYAGAGCKEPSSSTLAKTKGVYANTACLDELKPAGHGMPAPLSAAGVSTSTKVDITLSGRKRPSSDAIDTANPGLALSAAGIVLTDIPARQLASKHRRPDEDMESFNLGTAAAPLTSKPLGIVIELGTDESPIASYVIPEQITSSSLDDHHTLVCLSALSVEVKSELKSALTAIIKDYPSIGGLFLLSITKQALQHITGITPLSWNESILTRVMEALTPIAVEDPTWERSVKEDHKDLYLLIAAMIKLVPADNIEFFIKKYKAIICAEKGLTPSHIQMLAIQAYHETAPLKLSPIFWNPREGMILQIKRILSFVEQAQENMAKEIERLTNIAHCLPREKRLLLKRHLFSCLLLTTADSERNDLCYTILCSYLGTFDFSYFSALSVSIWNDLSDLPVILQPLSSAPVPTTTDFKQDINRFVDSLSVADKESLLGNNLRAILSIASFCSHSMIEIFIKRCADKYGDFLLTLITDDPVSSIQQFFSSIKAR